jgi:RNA polymerase sigma factor (sigma-70 family)
MKTDASSYTEIELIKALKAQQVEAYKYLYDHYSKAIFAKILSIVKQKEEAEDILQNAFVQIFQNISSYNHLKGRFYTWILNVAKHKAIDFIRCKNTTNRRRTIEFNNSTYQALTFNMKVGDEGLNKVLNTLPKEAKLLIDLAFFKGLTHLEIADFLNLPIGTVKTKIRTSLLKLRALLSLENV